MKIGSNIRKVRKSLELSQEAVIRNCKIKISQATLSKIENDSLEIDIHSERFLDISRSMGVSPDMVINYSESSNANSKEVRLFETKLNPDLFISVFDSLIIELQALRRRQDIILELLQKDS